MLSIPPQRRLATMLLVGLAVLAGSERWLATLRLDAPELRARARLVVTSGQDQGPGSLREAIFAADRAEEPVVIALRADRIVLGTPLPPLVNPKGVVIDATQARTEIDARGLVDGPVLDLSSPGSLVQGLRITGAAGAGVLVRATGVRLRGIEVRDCAEGVSIAAGASDVVLEDSLFESNGSGIKVAAGASGVVVRNSRFARHDQAAVWAVAPTPETGDGVLIRDNSFEDDRIAVVLVNKPSRVERNEFWRAREAAVYVMGSGAVLRQNRTRAGAGSGIFADEARGALIEQNELDDNAGVAIVLRSGGASVVQDNRVSRNGYGIVVVFGEAGQPNLVADNLLLAQTQDALFVLGGSPLLKRNRAMASRAAGLRILDFLPRRGPRVVAEPLLLDNVLRNNFLDTPVRGDYRMPVSENQP